MAKKVKKKKTKRRNPTDVNLLARAVVEAAIKDPLTQKPSKQKKNSFIAIVIIDLLMAVQLT